VAGASYSGRSANFREAPVLYLEKVRSASSDCRDRIPCLHGVRHAKPRHLHGVDVRGMLLQVG